jgi:hypothetical protein
MTMPLLKANLVQQLEATLKSRPSTAQSASEWASAYVAYAAMAMSASSSLPITATASQSTLVSAFTAAFQAQSSGGAAALIAQGVTTFWATMIWVGPTAVGTTLFPGNSSLSSALGAIFADTSGKSEADKARDIAEAFDAGAKTVMVNDILTSIPPGPVVGAIS